MRARLAPLCGVEAKQRPAAVVAGGAVAGVGVDDPARADPLADQERSQLPRLSGAVDRHPARCGEHAVLRRHPPLSLPPEKRGDVIVHGGGTEDLGFSEADEGRTVGLT